MKKKWGLDFLKKFKLPWNKKNSQSQKNQDNKYNHEYDDINNDDQVNKKLNTTFLNLKEKIQNIFFKFKKSKELKEFSYKNQNSNKRKINLSRPKDFIEIIFKPESRTKIHQAFIMAVVLSTTYGTAKLVAILITPSPTQPPKKQVFIPQRNNNIIKEIAVIEKENPFRIYEQKKEYKITKKGEQKKKRGPKICVEASIKSKLPFKLLHTTVLQDSVKSIASVQLRSTNEMLNIREGEKIQQLAKVGKIDRLNMVIKNLKNGECEYIENDSIKENISQKATYQILDRDKGKKLLSKNKMKGIKQIGNRFIIKKQLRDNLLSDMSSILTQARATSIRNPDGSMSFKISDITPGSIYSQLNIQEGDIINSINGKKISNINEIMNMFGRIKDLDNLSISVSRNGSNEKMEYSFK